MYKTGRMRTFVVSEIADNHTIYLYFNLDSRDVLCTDSHMQAAVAESASDGC